MTRVRCLGGQTQLERMLDYAIRLTRDHFRRVSRLYPEEPLFAQELELDNGIVSYPRAREREMIDYCESQLLRHIPNDRYHPCEWHV